MKNINPSNVLANFLNKMVDWLVDHLPWKWIAMTLGSIAILWPLIQLANSQGINQNLSIGFIILAFTVAGIADFIIDKQSKIL